MFKVFVHPSLLNRSDCRSSVIITVFPQKRNSIINQR